MVFRSTRCIMPVKSSCLSDSQVSNNHRDTVSLWLLSSKDVDRAGTTGLAAGAYRHDLAIFAQRHGASKFIVCFGIRRLDVSLLSPDRAGSREEVNSAGVFSGLILLI